MRTTVRLDDELLAQAKALAARTGRTLTAVIEDALRALLAVRSGSHAGPVRLPTVKGPLRPGIDLDDTGALLDAMERSRDPG